MKTTFLGQGFESNSVNAVGKHLIQYLNQNNFHTFIAISAFASEAGVFGLSSHIQSAKQNFQNLNLIVGIDQGGTSKEALEEILNLNINSYIFYQNESPIFHPKIYLFEGIQDYKLILGSSNLTRTGLFTNVESSLLIEFDVNSLDGMNLLSEIKIYYTSLFNFTDPNLFPISNSIIQDFVTKGIVPNEITRSQSFQKRRPSTNPAGIVSGLIVPRRVVASIPANFQTKPRALRVTAQQQPIVTPNNLVTTQQVLATQNPPLNQPPMNLVWRKLALSQSDAQHVPNGTAVTGNLKLTQARYIVNGVIIDQTTYFRNQIFNALQWVNSKANNNIYEEADCQFDISVLGNPIGTYTLKISHDPNRIAGQGNVPTWLHWGSTLMNYLQQSNYTGRTLNLYQSNTGFQIDIV
jgi:HKD family nuclease